MMLAQRLMHLTDESVPPSIIPVTSIYAPLAVMAVKTKNGPRMIVISYDKASSVPVAHPDTKQDGPEDEMDLDELDEDNGMY